MPHDISLAHLTDVLAFFDLDPDNFSTFHFNLLHLSDCFINLALFVVDIFGMLVFFLLDIIVNFNLLFFLA